MSQDQSRRVTATYTKSPLHRVVHGSGVWGGLTPQGEVRLSFYNESLTIPESIVLDVTPTGTTEVKEEREGGETPRFTRELEVDVVLGITVARSVHSWLGEKLKEYDLAMEQAQENKS